MIKGNNTTKNTVIVMTMKSVIMSMKTLMIIYDELTSP